MDMTRFLFTIQDAVDTVLNAVECCEGGEVFIPQINSFGMETIIQALEHMTQETINYEVIGLRPGEKLHEDMLAETELDFTYKVPDKNLLSVRPQYSNRTYQSWEKYTGPHFNSALHISNDYNSLSNLISKGCKESEVQ